VSAAEYTAVADEADRGVEYTAVADEAG